jgi:hypothetical protein
LIPSLSPADAVSTSAAAFPPFLKTDPQESKPNLLLVSSSHLHISIGNPHRQSASSSAPTTNKTLEEFLPQIQPHKNNNAAATHPLANSPKCRCSSSEILTTKINNQQNKHKHKQKPLFIFPVLKIFLSLQLQLVPKNFTIYCHQNKNKTWP